MDGFRHSSLSNTVYSVLWEDTLYEKVRVDGRIVSMAVLIVCYWDKNGLEDLQAFHAFPERSMRGLVCLQSVAIEATMLVAA